MGGQDGDDVRNTVSGSPHFVLQARTVHGNVTVQGTGRSGQVPFRVLGPAAGLDPLQVLDVRRVVGAGESAGSASSLTRYFERDHDRELRSAISAAANGPSIFAHLAGASTVGKSRALYEAICCVTPEWPVVKPQDADELLHWLDAGNITSGMILWLDEAGAYLDGDTGSKVAARLDKLLSAVPRIVAVGALWLDLLDKFRDEKVYPAVSRLLKGPRARSILVPEYLNKQERQAWAELAAQAGGQPDERVAAALDAAGEEGAVVQHLTRGPELLQAYRSGPGAGFTPVELALVTAALNVRRLGHGSRIPAALLEQAADGYLTDRQRPGAPGWGVSTLAGLSTGRRANGSSVGVGPILPALAAVRAGSEQEQRYLPDDYLDEQTRQDAGDAVAPPEVWDALTAHAADADDLDRLGSSAEVQGFYQHAAVLWVKAVNGGSTGSAQRLVELISRTCPQDIDDVTQWAVEHGVLGDPEDAAGLLEVLRKAGAGAALAYVLGKRPGDLASVEDPWGTASLISGLQRLGEQAAARELADRAAAATPISDPADLAKLVEAIHRAGASSAMGRLLAREPDQHVLLDDGYWLCRLLRALRLAGATPAATSLAARIAECAPAMPPEGFTELTRLVRALCGGQVARRFIVRMADHARLANAQQTKELVEGLRKAGAADAVARLLDRTPIDQIEFDDPAAVAELLRELGRAGAYTAAATLAREARPLVVDTSAALKWVETLRESGTADAVALWLERNPVDQITLDSAEALAALLGALRRAGAHAAAAALAARAAEQLPFQDEAHLPELLREISLSRSWPAGRKLAERIAENARLEDPYRAFDLVQTLNEAGAADAVIQLLDRNPVEQVELSDTYWVAKLLEELWEAGADTAAVRLAARAAEQLQPEDAGTAARCVAAVRETGGSSAVTRLLERNPVEQIQLGDTGSVVRLLEELQRTEAGPAVSAFAMHAAEHAEISDPEAVTMLARTLRRVGALHETFILLRRVAKATIPSKVGSTILDNFPKMNLNDPSSAYEILRYGPSLGNGSAHPWAWSDFAGRGFS